MVTSGCKEEVLYSRAEKMPDEAQGMMRLAQDKIKVNVIGTDKVADFKDETTGEVKKYVVLVDGKKPEIVEKSGMSGYIILHESDVAQFVKNTKRLQKILADEELQALAKKKGL